MFSSIEKAIFKERCCSDSIFISASDSTDFLFTRSFSSDSQQEAQKFYFNPYSDKCALKVFSGQSPGMLSVLK